MNKQRAQLVLEDGRVFEGTSVGIDGIADGEVVFNTSLCGYQEILTDPSYARQMVTLTYPHIGNVGTNALDNESSMVHASALIIRDMPRTYSNYRSSMSLSKYLRTKKIVAIADIDTRALTHHIRTHGAMRAVIFTADLCTVEEAQSKALSIPGLTGQDLAKDVTTDTNYSWEEGPWHSSVSPADSNMPHAVVVDFGVKQSILRQLVGHRIRVTVVHAKSTAEEIMALKPDGVLLSNGPGDPEPCDYAIACIQTLISKKIPLMGICLGFQLLGLSLGAKTLKMKYGHHGGNHPVQSLKNGRVLITSQNHGFCVDEKTLPADVTVTHRSLFDGTLQGFSHNKLPLFGFQGHPEAGPGPLDATGLFKQFYALMSGSDMNRPQDKTETVCLNEPT